MTDELDEADRERAERLRQRRADRSDPADRVRRVQADQRPPEELDLPGSPAPVEGADLPPELREELELTFKKLARGLDEEFGVDVEEDRHYWPLVLYLGVERLKAMWLEEVMETYEVVEELEPPE